jgi:methyltransferase (TIGR00027 family)
MRAAAPRAVRPEERLFEDPYADLFVSDASLRALMARPWLIRTVGRLIDRYYEGLIGEAVLRNRYTDDALDVALASGVEQVVLLGAGYDSTALRYAAQGLTFFEVDMAETQAHKREVLAAKLAPTDSEIEFVPCDLAAEDLVARMVAHGFAAERPAFVSCLAVSFYLAAGAFDRTMRALAALLAPGSSFVFNYLHREVIDDAGYGGRGARRARRAVARRGEPWVCGLAPAELPAWLRGYGFEVVDHLTGAEMGARYFGAAPPTAIADYISLVTASRVGTVAA